MRSGKRKTYVAVFSALVLIGVIVIYRTYVQSAPPPTEVVQFGGVSLKVEYATTSAAREKGLGGRENIPENYGMLFVFSKDSFYGFWMKDMRVSLDIFWLDDKGQVVSLVTDIATSTYPDVFYPVKPARYVLETAAGFARRHGIATGTPFELKEFPDVSG